MADHPGSVATKTKAAISNSPASLFGKTVTRVEEGIQFELAPRVESQLKDPRLGRLAGKLDIHSLNKLTNNPNAQFLFDSATGHINIVQNVEGKLLRLTVSRDTFKIISVGPIKERNLINSIANQRFIPIGNQLDESIQLDTYMRRIHP